MRETLVFFRDDDVGEMSDPLRAVLDTLLEAAIPCHYQVVPDYLDRDSAGRLRQIQVAHPELVFLNQHGLHHAQVLDGQQRSSEFGGGRPFADQLRDIRQGRDMLSQALGESFSSDVFTPPCHKYDAATLRALGDVGFETISAGVRADWPSRAYYALGRAFRQVSMLGKRVSYHLRRTPDRRLCEVSVAIDVHEDQNAFGTQIDKTAEVLWREFEFLRTRLPAVGVMLHHQACNTLEKQQTLREFVRQLRDDPDVRFTTICELAAPSSGARVGVGRRRRPE
ncbi:MAG: hypothetical protein CL908_06670 [Deltaproteobacteria bacterium]|nr:hypothetical protein [Deltaproteobacteria bacterium]